MLAPLFARLIAFNPREISVTGWLVARMFETTKFRSLFHPGYFITPPDQTAAEAMQSRREEAHGLMGMGTRMLQGEMDEVRDRNMRNSIIVHDHATMAPLG